MTVHMQLVGELVIRGNEVIETKKAGSSSDDDWS